MSDWHRRALAPVTPQAWEEIDRTASQVLQGQLSARKLIDFEGPYGPTLGAVNVGRLSVGDEEAPGDAPWGLRQVQSLVEVRIPIILAQMELDNISRGCKDPDLSDVEDAARKLVLFEETAVFRGFPPGGIEGLLPCCAHGALKLPRDANDMPHTVADGVNRLMRVGVGGPYALVLGQEHYFPLMEAGTGGYPPRQIIRNTLQGDIHWSPALEGGVLLSSRGGDFELVVGEDASIGYAMHDRDNVELYLSESFTFRVIDSAAAIALNTG
jgi:uncharacterized linocin/CFP29 family protein